MKLLKIVSFNLIILIFVLGLLSEFSFSWQDQIEVLSGENIVSLANDNRDKSIIYAASPNYIYKTKDGGKSWRKIYKISKANKKINRLFVGPDSSEIIYVATQDGLYQSQDSGENWKRVFVGNSDLENNCLCMAKSTEALYLGTEQGLFVSYNQAKDWHKSSGQFMDSIISSIIVDPRHDNIVYVACEKGVFISEDNGKGWQRIYVVYRSEIPTEDYSDYDGDVSDQVLNIKTMAISFDNPNRFYIATSRGIFFADNRGEKWQGLTKLGLASLNIRSIVISKIDGTPFVATDKGIFRLIGNLWKKVENGFAYNDFNDLIIDEDDAMLVGGKSGVFKIIVKDIDRFEKESQINAREITQFETENLFNEGPSIEKIQRAAIEYAEVNMNKIKSWRNQARMKAFFPTISVGYDKNVYGSSSGAMAVGPRDWDMSFSWNVADLVWSSDQTSIDTRSRLTVQLRQDVLDQVTHLYYEIRRIKAELLLSPPKDEKERLYKTLELQEVTANLDGLTNGYFSNSQKQK